MENLSTVVNQSGCFNQKDWLRTYLPFVEKFKAIREEWRTTIDKHFELMDSRVAAEKKAEKDQAKAKKQTQKETKQLQSEPAKPYETKAQE